YLTLLSDAEVAAANAYGWRLTMRLRGVNANDAVDGSVSAQIATAPNLYSISFGSDAAGNAKVQVTNGSVHTIPGGSGYHLYELEYDPVSGTASLKCDGALLQAGLVKSSNTMERVLWGANQTPSTGCGHYELVQFNILWPDPPPAPMPPLPPPPPGTVILLK
ncbi:MAG: hypothetical protein PHU80_09680, partial [Kiritimatiellae bacterium]|nr:hypothetical protein [Kiritimatiellia bacterium]